MLRCAPYCMFFGGNNFGGWAGDAITTAYVTDANVCPDGLPNQPKFSHLARGVLRAGTRSTMNLLLLLRRLLLFRASLCVFTLEVSHAVMSVRVLVLK